MSRHLRLTTMTWPTLTLLAVALTSLSASAAEPSSSVASNLGTADTRSAIAPRLPNPAIGDDAAPAAYLRAAAQALALGRTGEAQEAMERAESRALDRSVRPSQSAIPNRHPLIHQIEAARAALSSGDRGLALQLLQTAERDPEAGGQPK